jgi:hypothetical protein
MKAKKRQVSTYFGALKTSFKQSDSFTLKFIGSVFHTIEQEYFDIFAQYRLGVVDSNIGADSYGDVSYKRYYQLNHHARNDLDALIAIWRFGMIGSKINWNGEKYTRVY